MGNTADQVGNLDTSGVRGGRHSKLVGVTPVFDVGAEAAGAVPARDLSLTDRFTEKATGQDVGPPVVEVLDVEEPVVEAPRRRGRKKKGVAEAEAEPVVELEAEAEVEVEVEAVAEVEKTVVDQMEDLSFGDLVRLAKSQDPVVEVPDGVSKEGLIELLVQSGAVVGGADS